MKIRSDLIGDMKSDGHLPDFSVKGFLLIVNEISLQFNTSYKFSVCETESVLRKL